jgi:Spirocyclase AveC-like
VSNTTRTQGLVGRIEKHSPRLARALAAMGVVLVAVELVVVTRWITSPQFERVPVGASPMEGWRSALLQTMQIGFTAGGVIALYVFLVRPWIRERRLTFDGLLVVSTLFVSIYDPLSSYWHYWFTYNAYFLNRGSAVTVLPGWVPFAEPGQQIAWPMLLIPGEYVVLFVLLSMLGCKILRAIHRRWSGVRGISWIAAGTLFVVLASVSLLLEGFLLLPLGVYQMSGFAPLEFLGNHNAFKNFAFFGLAFTASSLVRYYRNDRGQTIVERGTERIKSHRRANLVRFLSVFAFVQLLMFFLYHLPVGLWTLAEKDAPWQDSMISNTWMNNGICGAGTPRLCPGQTELLPKP